VHQPTAYDQIVTKHSELTGILAKIAAEDRKPTEDEKAQLAKLKADIDGIKSTWESDGRKRFLETLAQPEATGQTVLKADQKFVDAVKGSYPSEFENLSLGRLIRGYVTGNWDGAHLEMKAMGSTPTTAGGILIPTVLAARIIDRARNLAAVLRAGAVTVPMTSNNLTMARVTGDVSAAWYAEAGTISESDMTFDAVTLTARKLASLVRVNNELLEDAGNIDTVILESFAAAMALELDRVSLVGTGTAPQPRGVQNTSGINTVAAVGTPSTYDKFIEAIFAVRGYNFEPNAVMYSTRTGERLAKNKTGISGDNTPLPVPADFMNLSKYVTNQIPNNLGGATNESLAFIGQWDQLMIGLRSGIAVEISRDASDVFSKDQTLLRCKWRGDVQVAQPRAFTLMSGILA
jgi:HK97 family phage major capsid protein